MYELVDSLTFKSRSISPNMWRVFELTYELFRTDAIDFLDGKILPPLRPQRQKLTVNFPEMLPSLDNFVSYGTDIFRSRADYREKALDIYTTALSSDHLGDNDRVNGCKLAESLLLNLRGHIDDVSALSPLDLLWHSLLLTVASHRNSSSSSRPPSVTSTKRRPRHLSWQTSRCSSTQCSTTQARPWP